MAETLEGPHRLARVCARSATAPASLSPTHQHYSPKLLTSPVLTIVGGIGNVFAAIMSAASATACVGYPPLAAVTSLWQHGKGTGGKHRQPGGGSGQAGRQERTHAHTHTLSLSPSPAAVGKGAGTEWRRSSSNEAWKQRFCPCTSVRGMSRHCIEFTVVVCMAMQEQMQHCPASDAFAPGHST